MVSAYLDVAEINALDHHIMTMQVWINELDSFLKMTRKNILKNAVRISHKLALEKAFTEFKKYRAIQDILFTPDFEKFLLKTRTNSEMD